MSHRGDRDLLVVTPDWERFDRVLELYWNVLYRDFGVDESTDWFHPHAGGEFVVALDDVGSVLGAARVLPGPGDAQRQLRQVAVVSEARRAGLGRRLVLATEDIVRAEGASAMWLNARESAIAFYERLGYASEGEMFVSELTQLPHVRMRKTLSTI